MHTDGFYNGDGPPDSMIDEFYSIPDAKPKKEKLSKTSNRPYKAWGNLYHPLSSADGYIDTGIASWYGKKFHGRKTSSGELYDMWAMTAAHPVLPLPTYVEVTNLDNGKRVVVRVNDRGPFVNGRIIDLSYIAAHRLGIAKKGTGRVKIKVISPKAQSLSHDHSIRAESDSFPQYYVQVAAYSQLENAIQMRKALRSKRLPLFPHSEDKQIALGAPYRIRVGPFRRQIDALSMKSHLEIQFSTSMSVIIL